MSINVLENTANINKETKLLVRFPKQATIFFKNKPKKPQPATRIFFPPLYKKRSPKSRIISGLGNCGSALLQSARAAQHIVERFHWSRGNWRFQHERFSMFRHCTRNRAEAAQKRRVCRAGAARAHCAFTPRQQERKGARSGQSITEDLVFKLK